jgi:MoxR-like ATPase
VLSGVASAEQISQAQALVQSIKVSDVLMRYVVDLVRSTREPGRVDKELGRAIEYGASPRASIALAAAARAHAFLDGRGYALPEDVKAIAPDVLRHRIMPTYEAEADGVDADTLVRRILDAVEMQ